MENEKKYVRTGKILNTVCKRYLLSTTLTAMAGSLNWFVDSFLVSHLLGSEAMSIVNICNPITFIMSMVYCCLGVGGSTMYAESLGKMDRPKAGQYFRNSVLASTILAIIISVLGISFTKQIAYVLCGKDNVYIFAISYLKIMFISTLPIISTGIISNFIIVSGKPDIATAVNVISNVVNICMDYVYIHFFGMKVEGAALATLTGNIIALAIIFYYMFIKKNIHIEYGKNKDGESSELKNIFQKGFAPALNQLGFSVKILVCNSIAMSLGGMIAVTVYSVCMQTVTIVTIILRGMLNAMFPILALLKGQKDTTGIRLFVKRIYLYQVVASIIFVFAFFVFAKDFMIAYKVPSEGLELGTKALKIFAFTHLFRPVTMIFMYYAQTIDMKKYAFIISLIDGLAGVPVIVYLLTGFAGITGLWLAFPVVAALLFVGIIAYNFYISKKTNGEYLSVLLLPSDEKNIEIFNATISENKDDISKITEELQYFCEKNKCDKGTSIKVAIACEEMCQYSLMNNGSSNNYMDIIVKIYGNKIEINIRSLGNPLDCINAGRNEEYSNAYVLYKMAKDVSYDYVMGMNQTKILIT